MNKKIQIFILFIFLVIDIIIAVLILQSAYKKLDSIYDFEIRREDSKKTVDAIRLTERAKDCEEDLCMVFEVDFYYEIMYGYLNFGKENICLYLNDYTDYIKRVEIKNGDTQVKNKYSKFKITNYDFSSLEPVKTIDVLKIVHENQELFKGYRLCYAQIIPYEGEEILCFHLSSICQTSIEKIDEKTLAYHIKSKKIEVVTGDELYFQDVEDAEAYDDQIDAFTYWDGYDLLVDKYFGEDVSWVEFEIQGSDQYPGRNYIYIHTKYLPVENKALYAKFPELKQYQGREDCAVYLSFTGFMSIEEIMTLLLEDGTEITFDGEILPAEKSKDGQEHAIQTFEDYNKWCKDCTVDEE